MHTIALLIINYEKSSPDREAVVILELHDFGRVADVHHALLDELEGEFLQRRRLVDGQGVVHVEPKELDLLQMEGSVDEHPVGREERRGETWSGERSLQSVRPIPVKL